MTDSMEKQTSAREHCFQEEWLKRWPWLTKAESGEGRRKPPGNELQKMPHTKARRFKPQARLEPTQ